MSARLAICLLTLVAIGAAAEDPWSAALRHEFNQAYRLFNATPSRPEDDRLHRLGTAAMLLNVQPRTPENLDRAATLLAGIYDQPALDRLGIAALYVAARLEQCHRTPARPQLARAHYRRLVALGSDEPLAQAAVVQLAVMELYDEARPFAERLPRAEALGASLKGPFAQGSFHLAVARSCLFFGAAPRSALGHLLAALDHGITATRLEADALVSAGELARELDQTGDARQCYARFLAAYPRDPRVPTIREQLTALGP